MIIVRNLRGWDIFGEITDEIYPLIDANKITYIKKRKIRSTTKDKEITAYDINFENDDYITVCEESFKKIMEAFEPIPIF